MPNALLHAVVLINDVATHIISVCVHFCFSKTNLQLSYLHNEHCLATSLGWKSCIQHPPLVYVVATSSCIVCIYSVYYLFSIYSVANLFSIILLRGESFLCHVFPMESVENLRPFWRTTQNLLILALLCGLYTINKLLKCIWVLRNISKDKNIIIMRVRMLQKYVESAMNLQ